MKSVYDGRGASLHQLNTLAEWVRQQLKISDDGAFDVLHLVEVDLPNIFPGLALYIQPDEKMAGSRAFISDDPLGIVVSESIYTGSGNGDPYSIEIILHEVGHLFLHRRYSALSMHSSNERSARIPGTTLAHSAEWQADMFALCVMYPYRSDKPFIDISSKYQASPRQMERLRRHFTRLKARENQRDFRKERRWLESIIETLPTIDRPLGKGQISFFHKSKAA